MGIYGPTADKPTDVWVRILERQTEKKSETHKDLEELKQQQEKNHLGE